MATAEVVLDITLVKEALLSIRHTQWYRSNYQGGCPRKQGKINCKAVFSWEGLDSSLKASITSIKYCLTKKKEICPAENQRQLDAKDVNTPTLVTVSPRSLTSRLCDLHRFQSGWRQRGTTCEQECCYSHEWPSERAAPLLYVKGTSPRQAIVLLHFGLLKEEDVTRLITENLPVAIFVMNLLHNSGVLDASVLHILKELSNGATPNCLGTLWQEEGVKSKAEVDIMPDVAIAKNRRRENCRTKAENAPKPDASEEALEEVKLARVTSCELKGEKVNGEYSKRNFSPKKRYLAKQSPPSFDDTKKARVEEVLESLAVQPTMAQQTLSPSGSFTYTPMKEVELAELTEEEIDSTSNEVIMENVDIGTGDSYLISLSLKEGEIANDMQELQKLTQWQNVSYGKRAVFDGIYDLPKVIDKYQKICEAQAKHDSVTSCIATLISNGSESTLSQKEDFEDLGEDSCVYYLTFGSPCPIEIKNKFDTDYIALQPGSMLILGPQTLRNSTVVVLPSRIDAATSLCKDRIILAYQIVVVA